jgi:hypothetical protein
MECYETLDLKLSALILSSISGSGFEILSQKDSIRKIIKISFPSDQRAAVNSLIQQYIDRVASVSSLFLYNKKLNLLRDRLKEGAVL